MLELLVVVLVVFLIAYLVSMFVPVDRTILFIVAVLVILLYLYTGDGVNLNNG